MIVGEPADLGLPSGSSDMQIISRHRLRPSFNVYTEDFSGGTDLKLKRTVYRWNGKYYVTTKARR